MGIAFKAKDKDAMILCVLCIQAALDFFATYEGEDTFEITVMYIGEKMKESLLHNFRGFYTSYEIIELKGGEY